MGFSNLIKQTKEIEIDGVAFVLKKFSVGFDQWLSLKTMESREMEFTDTGKVRKIGAVSRPEVFQEIAAEKIAAGVESWGLENAGQSVPVSPLAAAELARDFASTAEKLLAEIKAFNEPLSEEKKSS